MIKSVRIYYTYFDIERWIDTLYSIKGIKDIKCLDSCSDIKGVYYTFKIKSKLFKSREVDKEIFRKFPKAIIFNEKGWKL